MLRAAAVPGAGLAIGASVRLPFRLPIWALLRLSRAAGLLDSHDAQELLHIWTGLRDPSTRSAFLRTLRSVVDLRGQSVSSRDRLYLAAATPMLLIWGSKDPVLPVDHARTVAAELDGCRLEIVPGAGHLPHHADPEHVSLVLRRFIETTAPATHDPAAWRRLLGPALVQ